MPKHRILDYEELCNEEEVHNGIGMEVWAVSQRNMGLNLALPFTHGKRSCANVKIHWLSISFVKSE